jgi:hypothetical protein
VFENSVLRRIFGPNRQELPQGWKKLLNTEFHNYFSTNIISMTKCRRMRHTENIAHGVGMYTKFLPGNLNGIGSL